MGGPPNGHLGGTKSLASLAPPTLGFLSLPLRCWKAKHRASCAQPSRRGEPGRARNPGQSAAAEIVATARGAARRRGAVVEATVITSPCAHWAAQAGALSAPEPQGAVVRAAEDRRAVGSHPPSPARGGPVGSRPLRAAAGNGALARPTPAGSATWRPRLGPPLSHFSPEIPQDGVLRRGRLMDARKTCHRTQRAGWPRGPGHLCSRCPAAGRLTH